MWAAEGVVCLPYVDGARYMGRDVGVVMGWVAALLGSVTA